MQQLLGLALRRMERPRNLEQRKVLSPSLHPGPRLVLQEALTIQPHSLVPAAILLWCSKGLPNRGPSSLLPLDAGPVGRGPGPPLMPPRAPQLSPRRTRPHQRLGRGTSRAAGLQGGRRPRELYL